MWLVTALYLVVTAPYLVVAATCTLFQPNALYQKQLGILRPTWWYCAQPCVHNHWRSIYMGQMHYTKRVRHPAPYLVVTTPYLVICTLCIWIKCIL